MQTKYGERPGLTVDGDANYWRGKVAELESSLEAASDWQVLTMQTARACSDELDRVTAERDAARAEAARLRAACDEARALLSEAKRRGPCVDAAWCKLYDATEAGKDGAK